MYSLLKLTVKYTGLYYHAVTRSPAMIDMECP